MAQDAIKNYLVGIFLISGLLWPQIASAQKSLYRDVKANTVGDVITVILLESTNGSSTSDARLSSSASGSAGGSMSGNFMPFKPTFGADATVNYGSDQKNLSNQRQLLEGFISVQIKEVTPNGDLIVEGNRLTEVNGEVHEMMLNGIVRQNDVNSDNEVLSYRIANANISYQKKGGINPKTKNRGILKKAAIGVVSLGLSAVVILKQLGN
ncbi:flagellar basal body L-ring protein FlgH [Gracilimonas sp. Q87]|uniref:flagellar basal body L-ring protein FlgH n=1 Tax=Gracilimonas sp. Q87 TaxID=3384766 RepID=UPI003983E556